MNLIIYFVFLYVVLHFVFLFLRTIFPIPLEYNWKKNLRSESSSRSRKVCHNFLVIVHYHNYILDSII